MVFFKNGHKKILNHTIENLSSKMDAQNAVTQ